MPQVEEIKKRVTKFTAQEIVEIIKKHHKFEEKFKYKWANSFYSFGDREPECGVTLEITEEL